MGPYRLVRLVGKNSCDFSYLAEPTNRLDRWGDVMRSGVQVLLHGPWLIGVSMLQEAPPPSRDQAPPWAAGAGSSAV